MKNNLILEISHLIMSKYITANDILVDATMGNGYDTLFLAQHSKYVYAFDIQEQALIETQKLIKKNDIKNVTLIKDSHENILNYVREFKGVVFNLGYLPHGDKSITTKKDITIKTIQTILPILKADGFVLLVVYTGHEQGMEESIGLETYFNSINQNSYKILKTNLPFQDNNPPFIYFILKVKDESN